MEFLTDLLDNSSIPWVSAIVLGLMTSVSPCPLATNITAIGYIGRDLGDRNRVFLNGLYYTLGRMISYSLLAVLIYLGADQFKLSGFFQLYGDKIIGPFLILVGLILLGIIRINLPSVFNASGKLEKSDRWRFIDSFLLGAVFALAFCPYSGVLYFGMLIPLTISTPAGLLLPLFFSFATALPVIIFAWIIAYTVHGLGAVYNKVKDIEVWFRKIIAFIFIAIGIYYCFRLFI